MHSLKYRERFQISLATYKNARHFPLKINFPGNNLAVIEFLLPPYLLFMAYKLFFFHMKGFIGTLIIILGFSPWKEVWSNTVVHTYSLY